MPIKSVIRFITDKTILYLVCPNSHFISQTDIPIFVDVINRKIKNYLRMGKFEFSITVPLRNVVQKEQELCCN